MIDFKVLCAFHLERFYFLIEQGFNDLLLGYPAYDERALCEISLLTKKGFIITCMVDCEEHIVYLEKKLLRNLKDVFVFVWILI